MEFNAAKVNLPDIQHFRALFLQENNFQFICNSFHERGWADVYLLTVDGKPAGYGAINGRERFHSDRDTVFEFYLIPPFRKYASRLFSALIVVSGATFIECQSNDRMLSPMLYEFAENIFAEAILFEDFTATDFQITDAVFRLRSSGDCMAGRNEEDMGKYVLESKGEIVATGGFLLHYNHPFADLYMEVHENQRRRGLGSFILQEIKKECYRSGRVPAARCNVTNKASKATLLKAGMAVCGARLVGSVPPRSV